jgi:hypothetical protein
MILLFFSFTLSVIGTLAALAGTLLALAGNLKKGEPLVIIGAGGVVMGIIIFILDSLI